MKAQQVLTEYHHWYLKNQPVAAGFQQQTLLPGFDDLGPLAFQRQKEELQQLQLQARTCAPLNTHERLLLHEMHIGIQHRLHQLEAPPLGHMQLDALMVMTLLPLLQDPTAVPEDLLQDKLSGMQHALQMQLDAGVCTERDLQTAPMLQHALHVLRQTDMRPLTLALLDAVEGLLQRRHVQGTPEGQVLTGERLEAQLQCVGSQLSLTQWLDLLQEALHAELERINTVSGTPDALVVCSQQVEWDASMWGASQQESPEHPTLVWLRQVHRVLSQHAFVPIQGVKLEVGPELMTVVAPEALFLPAPTSTLWINPNMVKRQTPLTRREKLYLASLVAHEILGHHQHDLGSQQSPAQPHLQVLQNPFTLEGWAVHAELAVLQVDPTATAVVGYQRFRRLLPPVLTLTQLLQGPQAVKQLVRALVRQCPDLLPEFQRPNFLPFMRRSNPTYGVGLIEVEYQLLKQQRRHPHLTVPQLHQMFTGIGPISARSVTAFLADPHLLPLQVI